MKYIILFLLFPVISRGQVTVDSLIRYNQLQNITVKTTGTDASGKAISLPIGGKATSTHTVLGANATWVSDTMWYNGNNNIQLAIQTNVLGTYLVEYFNRDGVKAPFMGNITSFDPTIVAAFQAAIAGKGDGVRITYINGPVAQSSFYLEVGLLNNPVQETLRSMGTTISATNLGGTTHAAIEGKDSSFGNVYRQVTTTTTGNKTGIDVNIANLKDTQNVKIMGPLSVTSSGTQNVNVTGFDSAKSRLYQVADIRTIPPITIANPTFQDSTKTRLYHVVGGALAVTNPYIVSASDSTKYRKNISIDFLPPVTGIMTVSNPVLLDSTKSRIYQLSTVLNPYIVSAADSNKYRKVIAVESVPLAPNAATASAQASELAVFNTLATGQTYSNSSLATIATNTAGVSTAAGQATMQTSLNTLATASTPATTGSFTQYTLVANTAQTLAASTGRKTVKVTSVSGTVLVGVGFTATASNYAYRIITNGTAELLLADAALSISILSTTAATVNVATSN